MTKPRVDLHHPAMAHDGPNERTLLIVFANGAGCLVSLRTYGDTNIIDIYNSDDGIVVMRPDKSDPKLVWKGEANG